MDYEFDTQKSESNKLIHGIDFYEAQALWMDPDFLEVPVKTSEESRYLVIGMISGKHWTGVINFRGDKIRIISMRWSQKEEVGIYEG